MLVVLLCSISRAGAIAVGARAYLGISAIASPCVGIIRALTVKTAYMSICRFCMSICRFFKLMSLFVMLIL